MIIAYKLVRKLKDGTLAPLFIERTRRYPVGEWLNAYSVPTKGFAMRPGFHACKCPVAPHLSKKNRVWCRVELCGYTTHERPVAQGGTWFTARRMRIIEELN